MANNTAGYGSGDDIEGELLQTNSMNVHASDIDGDGQELLESNEY